MADEHECTLQCQYHRRRTNASTSNNNKTWFSLPSFVIDAIIAIEINDQNTLAMSRQYADSRAIQSMRRLPPLYQQSQSEQSKATNTKRRRCSGGVAAKCSTFGRNDKLARTCAWLRHLMDSYHLSNSSCGNKRNHNNIIKCVNHHQVHLS